MVSVEIGLAERDQDQVNDEYYRCSISDKLAAQLDKDIDSHIRVETSSGLNGYYQIKDIHSDTDRDLKISRHDKGLSRIQLNVGDTVAVLSTVPLDDPRDAFPNGDIAETFWEQTGSEVFISCPHGGDIEYNTDEMGQYLFKKLLGQDIPSTMWALQGFYTSQNKDAFKRWHVKKPIKAYDAYPGVKKLVEEKQSFKYGIGFHIHSYDYVAVGGMADTDLREMIAESIRRPVPSKYEIETEYEEMALTGRGKKMSMNYFAENYQGIQIEMPRRVAYNKFHTLPEAVADRFADLL